IKCFRQYKVEDRFCSFLDGADRCDTALPNHRGGHISSWMQAIHCRRRGIELACKIEREHDLREFALGISPPAGITACEHNIIKIDWLLAERGDVHNAGGLANYDERQQQICEQKSGEIIDGEAQFV